MAVEKNKENLQVRDDSLIKDFKVVESDRSIYAHKIVFITVRDIELTYYTNAKPFVQSLEKFKGEKFVISYFIANTDSKDAGNRIVKVKLPKNKS